MVVPRSIFMTRSAIHVTSTIHTILATALRMRFDRTMTISYVHLHTVVIKLLASVRAQLTAAIEVLRRFSIEVDIHLITIAVKLLISIRAQ